MADWSSADREMFATLLTRSVGALEVSEHQRGESPRPRQARRRRGEPYDDPRAAIVANAGDEVAEDGFPVLSIPGIDAG
jgi:hypothetical protein